jgi:hypothetical protein
LSHSRCDLSSDLAGRPAVQKSRDFYCNPIGRRDEGAVQMDEALEAKVLGSHMVEGSGIYLWLLLPGTTEPRYYVLPWNQKTTGALWRYRRAAPLRALLGQARLGLPSAAAAEAAG